MHFKLLTHTAKFSRVVTPIPMSQQSVRAFAFPVSFVALGDLLQLCLSIWEARKKSFWSQFYFMNHEWDHVPFSPTEALDHSPPRLNILFTVTCKGSLWTEEVRHYAILLHSTDPTFQLSLVFWLCHIFPRSFWKTKWTNILIIFLWLWFCS